MNDTKAHIFFLCLSVLPGLSAWYLYSFWGIPSLWVVSIAAGLVRKSGLPDDNKGKLNFLILVTHTLRDFSISFPLWYMCVPAVLIYLLCLAEGEDFPPKVQDLVWGVLAWSTVILFNWRFFGLWSLFPVARFYMASLITDQAWTR